MWLTLGVDPRAISVCSAAQRLVQDNRPCHLVWDPLTGDLVQLLPIARAGCALGAPETIDYAPGLLPCCPRDVNREGRLCVQIGVLGSPRDPFTSYQMLGLSEILAWLDSWQVPRRWPAGAPAPYRTTAKVRSRALWALGGHYGASQVPECQSIGPGGIDIDQIATAESVTRELTAPALTGTAPIRLGPRVPHEVSAGSSLSAAAV